MTRRTTIDDGDDDNDKFDEDEVNHAL